MHTSYQKFKVYFSKADFFKSPKFFVKKTFSEMFSKTKNLVIIFLMKICIPFTTFTPSQHSHHHTITPHITQLPIRRKAFRQRPSEPQGGGFRLALLIMAKRVCNTDPKMVQNFFNFFISTTFWYDDDMTSFSRLHSKPNIQFNQEREHKYETNCDHKSTLVEFH